MYKNDKKFIEVNAGREQKGKKVKNSFGGDHKRDFFFTKHYKHQQEYFMHAVTAESVKYDLCEIESLIPNA
jgi:hypothetical protein